MKTITLHEPYASLIALGVKLHETRLVAVKMIGGEISRNQVTEADRRAGGWASGRYAWELDLVHVLAEPVPARGKQGIWEWEPPAEVMTAIEP